MKCLTIKDKWDTKVLEENVSLRDLLSSPIVGPKDKLPLWRFCTQIEGAKGRTNDQLESIHCLMVEYDSGEVTVEEFIEKYSEYAFALYTSPSHSPVKHKFRVILPLDQPYEFALWSSREVKTAMLNVFPNIDPTCFTNWQRIPGCESLENYRYFLNSGKKFGFDVISKKVKDIIEEEKISREIDRAFRINRANSGEINKEAYKAKVDDSMNDIIRQLPSHKNGSRYIEFCSAMGKLLNAKYPDGQHIYSKDDVEHMLKRVYWDGDLAKALRSFARKRK